MKKQYPAQNWESMPTPIALSADQVFKANSPDALGTALMHFSNCTLSYLKILGTALCNHISGEMSETKPLSVSLKRRHAWNSAESIMGLWNALENHFSGELRFEERCESSFPEVSRIASGLGIKKNPTNTLAALELLGLCGKKIVAADNTVALLQYKKSRYLVTQIVESILPSKLIVLAHWKLQFVEPPIVVSDSTYQLTVFEGVYPRTEVVERTSHQYPVNQLFVSTPETDSISLHPFAVHETVPIVSINTMENDSTYRPNSFRDTYLLSDLDIAGNTTYLSPKTNSRLRFNELIDKLVPLATTATYITVPSWNMVSWGLAGLEIADMRTLNQRFGHAIVDTILQQIDATANTWNYGPLQTIGGAQLFPFWRHGDTLLVPFAWDNVIHPQEELEQRITQAISAIMAAAFATLPKSDDSLRFNAFLSLPFGPNYQYSGLETEILAKYQEFRVQVKEYKAAEEQHAVTWFSQRGQSQWEIKSEQGFSRLSRAAFGIIRRDVPDGAEFLLRWNKNHQGFNFIGGHMEILDCEEPERTLTRELQEELGIAPGSCTYSALLNHSLRSIEFSDHKNAWTCYDLAFFLIRESDLPTGFTPVSEQECTWVTLDELKTGQTVAGKAIRPFPLRLLLPHMD